MCYIGLLILATVFLYIRLKKILDASFSQKNANCAALESAYADLAQENPGLEKENSSLGESLQETVALYDITQDICRTLNEKQMFTFFKERLSQYIEVKDCRFLAPETDISRYRGYAVLPLMLDRGIIGYLAAGGITEQDTDKFHILAQQFLLGMKRALLYKKVHELAISDALTGVFSRRYFLERLDEEIARCKKFNYKFSFLMADIDHFKSYNDRYGHLVGDVILREVAKTIKETIRQVDFLGRYGGEELTLILTETDKSEAYLAAERIRQAIEASQIKAYDEVLKVTISIGISTFPIDAKDTGALIDSADKAMYQAKETGRNRVVAFGAPGKSLQ